MTPEERSRRNDELVRRYQAGEHPKKIALSLGISWARAYQILRGMGVTRSASQAARVYTLNERYFDNLTPEAAYWVGFILADGCITDEGKLKVGLSHRDEDHLHLMRRALGYNGPLNFYRTKAGHGISTLTISSQRLSKSLQRLGVKPRKSQRHGTPKVPAHLKAPMYLGYFDGDGSIFSPASRRDAFYGIHLIGSDRFCQDLVVWADRTGARLRQNGSRVEGMAQLRGGTEATIRLLTYLYQRSPVWLPRKYRTFKRALADHLALGEKSRTRKRLGKVWDQAWAV